MHIAVAGNIGSGKTTLTQMLADHYGWEARFESVDYNPYLSDYYDDIPRWSFNMEVYFLKERFKDILAIAKSDKPVIGHIVNNITIERKTAKTFFILKTLQ